MAANPPNGWETVFQEAEDEWETIEEILEDRRQKGAVIVPPPDKLFRAFELTPLDEVRVVIFADEPHTDPRYPSTSLAQGLAFSSNPSGNITEVLTKIYNEIRLEYGTQFSYPSHGCLDAWARQGVLLVCNSLTSEEREEGESARDSACKHGKIWNGFMIMVIRAIKDTNPDCIYVAWGKSGGRLMGEVGDKGTNLEGSHPLAYRGFSGCGHFLQINQILAENQRKRIVAAGKKDKIVFSEEEVDEKVAEEGGIQGINWNVPDM